MSKKLMTSFALAGVLALAACGDSSETEPEGGDTASQSAQDEGQSTEGGAAGESESGEQPEMPEADTEDIPDVVAEVNGDELSGEDFTVLYESQFQQLAMQSQMTGEEPDQDQLKEQTLDSMIGNELLLQDARDQGFEASDEDVEALITEQAEANGMESADEFIEAYEEQGMSEEQLTEDARSQVLINQLLDDLDVEEPSEEELREIYDEAAAAQEESGEEEQTELPPFEEVRDDVAEQATSDARNEAALDHVEQLRSDAEIETHL
ncbi:SurA N-terminal domain-containing protein [Nesterenkonia lutea]|uniref:Peptidyl-prolyl cis-trans isomerase SurA n=1 Tax=Nesterenkonia lutea TaxID=272919 RepID=A0ABR9JHJ3_9MICC|nr:SurA N-terminal domain-containing protein [Nesterenkonia lutea]MBE1525255.1 peptidyl-prolyl cis-trans isomerase SurA [Nesterenkonia lutea]